MKLELGGVYLDRLNRQWKVYAKIEDGDSYIFLVINPRRNDYYLCYENGCALSGDCSGNEKEDLINEA